MPEEIGQLAIIGAGVMGSAFARGLISKGLYHPNDIMLSDTDPKKLSSVMHEFGVRTTSDNQEAACRARVVLLAVKPSVVSVVLDQVREVVDSDQLVISIAAGVRIDLIESHLLPQTKVIRAMPNIACRIGEGAIAYARGSTVEEGDVQIARKIFEAVGLPVEVPEELMNAATGLSGSGPAYVFVLIEALADAGVRVGLTREAAFKLATQTVLGAARLVIEECEHPARLKDQVASPGGTTIAGLDALERCGFRSAIIEAVKAATKRAEELE
ncbi:MAG: pyrroline-5-carboxylate reductase [Armatimonadota bacterium]